MRGPMTWRVPALAVVLAAAGCGDGPICPSEIMVDIVSPTGDVVEDSSGEAGVQTDVAVSSNLHPGESFTLTVLQDGVELAIYDAIADDYGGALFEDVTVPT